MAPKNRKLSVIGVLLSLLWSAACSPAVPTSTPTLDLNPIRTEVAATVLAQVTQVLALTPTITPLPSPTATDLPTATPSRTASAAPSATAVLSSLTPSVGTENKAQWISQTVADGTTFKPGETFTMTWRLKNTGTSTWTAGYLLRYYSGDTFGAPKEVSTGREVLPGDEIEINIQMKAPLNPGSYSSVWVMANENRANFKEPVYLNIKVALPTATATATLKPTATP
jgi:hypothetical protein